MPSVLLRIVEVEPFDPRPRRHDGARPPVAEAQRHLDDRRLGVRDVPGRNPLAQHKGDLLVGDGGGSLAAHGQQAKHKIGRGAQEPLDRCSRPGNRSHEAAERSGNPLGMEQGDALWDEFAEDQREIGYADHDNRHADQMGVSRGEPVIGPELPLELVAQGGFPKSTGEDGDQGDADLDGREQSRGIRFQFERRLRAAIPGLGERHQAGLPRRDQPDLGHRKHAVHDDQQEDDREVQDEHRNRLSKWRPPKAGAPPSVWIRQAIAQWKKPRAGAALRKADGLKGQRE